MPNRLANETSPYLLQHSHQPVDWFPWGAEAFDLARATDKPVLLSVGYSACHWCHVMAHESFDDPRIASYLNEHFVSIKVDREERPDLDSIYMDAVVAATGRGGWPMTAFLTPEGRPFFGGTYFPPEDRMGMAGFPRVLQAIVAAYRDRRDDVARSAEQLTAQLHRATRVPAVAEEANAAGLDVAFEALLTSFDGRAGGFGAAPKFPQPLALEFALRVLARSSSPAAATILRTTLDRMSAGGMHDQVGGGFHRYSVDGEWLVPHFEKMLYDNALLSRLYALAYQATGIDAYRGVACSALDYVLRDLASKTGGFCAAEDADSDGNEGRFYVWPREEFTSALEPDIARIVAHHFGVTDEGNFEGANVLHVAMPADQVARQLGVPIGQVRAAIASARTALAAVRSRRTRPARDGKVLANWNGLVVRALADAGSALGRQDYVRAAESCAEFVAAELVEDGRVRHLVARLGVQRFGFLDDHAAVVWGLLGLHRATLAKRWLDLAARIVERMLEYHWSEGESRFYDTSSDHEALIARPHGLNDNASPSGSALACSVLIDLGRQMDLPRYLDIARRVLMPAEDALARYPTSFATALLAVDSLAAEVDEVTIFGRQDEQAVVSLLAAVSAEYRPYQIVRLADPDSAGGRPAGTSAGPAVTLPWAIVCRGSACGLPTSDPESLRVQLRAPALPPASG
jgi:hypothetical protein